MVQISWLLVFLALPLLPVEVQKPLSGLNLDGFQDTHVKRDIWDRNPFAQDQDDLNGKKPKLYMIVAGKNDAAALINGKMLRVHDRLGTSEIVSIKIGEVILRNENGLSRLKLDGPKSKITEVGSYNVQIKDAPLGDAVKLLAMMQNKNVVMPGKLEDMVNASFPHIGLLAAMQAVLESRDLTSIEHHGVIRIVSKKDQEAFGGDLITRTFTLKYAKGKDIKDQAAQLVSTRGTVMIDERTNSLTMRDTANYIKNMETYIESIDFADRQVLIEGRIVEASTDFMQSFGIQWGAKIDTAGFKMNGIPGINNVATNGLNTLTNTNYATNVAPSGAAYIQDTRAGRPLVGVAIGIPLTNSELDFELSAAENNHKATVLSRPSIITTNNQPATIHSGRKVFIPVSSGVAVGTNGSLGSGNGLQVLSAGITMVVTPQITVDGKIRLLIDVTSSQFNQASSANNGIPDLSDNNAKTQVLLKDGETTVLGGLYQTTKSEAKGGMPFLSRIPFIGSLFRNSTDAADKRELLVFIKPKIVEQQVLKELDRSEKEPPNDVFEKP